MRADLTHQQDADRGHDFDWISSDCPSCGAPMEPAAVAGGGDIVLRCVPCRITAI